MRLLTSRSIQGHQPLDRPLIKTALIVLALLGFTAPALSISVTNRDDKDHKLTIIEGDAKADHVLKPSASLDGICLKGCVIRLSDNENDEYELEGTEIVSIEDGYLYYDGPDSGAEMAPGSKALPPSSQPADPGAPNK